MDSKTCSLCGASKSTSEFYRDKTHADGVSSRCAKCCRQADRKRYARAPKHRQAINNASRTRRKAARVALAGSPIPESKRCSRCGELKSKFEFQRECSNRDGLLNYCGECNNRLVRERRKFEPERFRATRRASWQRNKHKTVYNEKRKAKARVQEALLSGRLTKKSCVYCGNLKTDGHHDDYSKPLDVRWLCRACHAKLHRDRRIERCRLSARCGVA